jgi:SET domain-containing protein
LRLVTFFTTPLFQDPTWYASGGPMIYALVEPSIYMVASIPPTTRHLYRRLRSKARLTSQTRSAKSDSAPDSDNSSRSTDEEHRQSRETAGYGHMQQRHISQEELTLEQFFGRGKPGEPKPDERPREMAWTKIETRDRGRPTV